MRMNKLIAGGVVGLTLIGAVIPATALPLASNGAAIEQATPATTTDVRWRGRGWGWGVGAAALGLGLAAGAYPYYYGGYGPGYGYGPGPYAPAYYGGPVYAGPPQGGDPVAYCMQTYRSYDPRSGTYLGYDGYRHPCP
jgi:BA14K-like protein